MPLCRLNNINIKYIAAGLLALGICMGASNAARAQLNSSPPIEQDRRIPDELRPVPIKYKGLQIRPVMRVNTIYNSNIFLSQEEEISDYSLQILPGIQLTKQYESWAFDLAGNANIEKFATEKTEDQENFSVNFRGSYQPNSHWAFPFSLQYIDTYLGRSSPIGNLSTSVEPIDQKQFGGSIGVSRTFNRLSLALLGEYSELEYGDGVSVSDPSSLIILSDNDRATVSAKLSGRYDLIRGGDSEEGAEHYIFAELEASEQDHKRLSFVNGAFQGINRDRNEYAAIVGFQTGYKRLITAKLGTGYIIQKFEEENVDTTTAFNLLADIKWAATKKTSLGFSAGRDISQDNILVQGIVNTNMALTLEHEFRHNFYSSVGIGYTNSDFRGIDREDDILSTSVSAQYIISPRLSMGADIIYTTRSSDVALQDYDQTRFLLSLTGRL